jgi:hypothetical protein
MQAHFSILSASIRPEIQEQIAIGLLLVGSNYVYFETSKTKLEISSKLVSPQIFKFLKDTVRQISKATIAENRKFKDSFSEIDHISKSFSFGYLHYLSNYSNNILTFSSPKTIDLPADNALFEMLFKKYIDENGIDPKKPQLHNFDLFKREFFPKVKPYFNTDQEITAETIPGLLMPVKIDLIGKNEIPVYAQSIDLERQNYHIQNDIGVLLMLKEALGEAKGFLISSEPDKNKFPSQHDIWRSIRNWNDSEYVDISESQKIEDYATQHGVVPLI